MSQWINIIEASKVPALFLSLCFNVAACAAIQRLWKSREALQDKVTDMLMELLAEINRRYWSERSK